MGAERAPCPCWTPMMVSPLPPHPTLPLHVTAWYVQLTSYPAWTLRSPLSLITSNRQWNLVSVFDGVLKALLHLYLSI